MGVPKRKEVMRVEQIWPTCDVKCRVVTYLLVGLRLACDSRL
jgi:hypothetical protein